MITVNSTSGGRSSNFLTVKYPADINIFSCVTIKDERYTPKDKGLLRDIRFKLPDFIATAESDLTLRNLIDIEEKYGIPIVWVSGNTFEEVIETNGRGILPSAFVRYCTTWLKIVPIFEYLYTRGLCDNEGKKVLVNIGIRNDEIHRKYKMIDNNKAGLKIPISCNTFGKRRLNWETFDYRELAFPLLDNNHTLQEIQSFWSKEGFMYPLHSNCVGCFHKTKQGLADQFKYEEKINWFIDQEDKKEGRSTWINGTTYRKIKEYSEKTPYLFDLSASYEESRRFNCNCTD